MASSMADAFGNLALALLLMAFFGLLGSFFGLVGVFVGVAVGITLALGSIHHGGSEERDPRPPGSESEGDGETA